MTRGFFVSLFLVFFTTSCVAAGPFSGSPLTQHLEDAATAPTASLPQIVITAEDQQNWSLVSKAFDQCVADLALRDQSTICRSLALFLADYAEKIKQASAPK